MMQVGLRQLKTNLSRYMGKVRRGQSITITDRRHAIAVLSPLEQRPDLSKRLLALAHEGVALSAGHKPKGLARPVAVSKSRSVSSAILEDRP